MKIDGIKQTLTSTSDIKRERNPRLGNYGTDNLALSEAGKLSRQINAAVKNAPEVRLDKVNSLRQAIQSGQYLPDSQAIARRMLESN